ncbi:hypothetical protein [Marispirochaeta aestuarii]|uniref:hypothetical protein n=1 Tax=Marispirochaeta aestuarii TaxID=1963862 RepID=UPI0029C664AB|nr:hypothetical protein [Marispirochaeta aestuarii]
MRSETLRLRKHIDEQYELYCGIDDTTASINVSPEAWSVKEIFGHLIDSAANNYQRFIRLQEVSHLDFPGYDYNWIKIIKYNSYPYSQLLELWKQFNLLLCHIIENLDESKKENSWKNEGRDLSLSFLVTDYIDHLEIHLSQLAERLKAIREKSAGS